MKEKVVLLPWCWSNENSVVTEKSEVMLLLSLLQGILAWQASKSILF